MPESTGWRWLVHKIFGHLYGKRAYFEGKDGLIAERSCVLCGRIEFSKVGL